MFVTYRLCVFYPVCRYFFSSRRRHTSCALVTGVQTCALPILLFRDGIDRWLPRTVFASRLPAALLAHTGGNTTPNPDYFRFAQAAAPALLETARAMDRDGHISAYVDLKKGARMIVSCNERSRASPDSILRGVQALVLEDRTTVEEGKRGEV